MPISIFVWTWWNFWNYPWRVKSPNFNTRNILQKVQGTCKEDNLGKNRVKGKNFSSEFLSLLSLCVSKFLAGQWHWTFGRQTVLSSNRSYFWSSYIFCKEESKTVLLNLSAPSTPIQYFRYAEIICLRMSLWTRHHKHALFMAKYQNLIYGQNAHSWRIHQWGFCTKLSHWNAILGHVLCDMIIFPVYL